MCTNHRARFLAGRNRPATSFPLSDSVPFFHRRSRIILCKTSPAPIYFWLTVSAFGQTDLVRKQANVQESSGPLLASASQPIRTGCESDPACLLGLLGDAVVCTNIVLARQRQLEQDDTLIADVNATDVRLRCCEGNARP